MLVPFEATDDAGQEPRDPDAFAADFAAAVNGLLADPDRSRQMGRAGRARVVEHFSWPAIARETLGVYERLVAGRATATA